MGIGRRREVRRERRRRLRRRFNFVCMCMTWEGGIFSLDLIHLVSIIVTGFRDTLDLVLESGFSSNFQHLRIQVSLSCLDEHRGEFALTLYSRI
jgi:hypothetical protein